VFNGFDPGKVGASGFWDTGLSGVLGAKGVVGKTLLAGAQTFTTNVASSAINAFNWSNGELGWDTNAFTRGAFGTGALASVAGAAGAAGTSTLLSGNLTGFSGLHKQDVLAVSNLAGGFASSGIQYGMTGETTLNVLRLAGESQGRSWGYGLMEMHLGGDQGFGMNVGSNGTDMSVGTIGRAMAGMGTFVKQQEFNWYEAFGGVEYAADYTGSREVGTQLRENYSFGDHAAHVQQERLLNGQDKLRVGYIGNEGQTTAVGDSRVVDLATLGQKGSIASQLAAGVVMQHEVYRNGVYDGQLGQEYETQRAVLGHTEMALRVAKEYGMGFVAQNAKLSRDVAEYVKGPESFAKYVGDTYDSTADYWKLVKAKGKYYLEFDAKTDIYDEKGNFLVGTGDSSATAVQGALAKYLGVSSAEAAAAMFASKMKAEGASWVAPSVSAENMGKRIEVDGPNDPTLTAYLFTAENHNQIMDEIAAEVSGNPNKSRAEMRAELMDFVGYSAGDYSNRYLTLRQSMVDFYLGSGTVDDRVYPRGQGFGAADPEARQFYAYHTGYDARNPAGTSLTAAWPGMVETSEWSDSIGDNVSVMAGYQFEGLFMEAGFSYAYAHMSSLSVESSAGVIANQLMGLSGHEGTMVVGQPGDHNHLTISNENYGQNRYLSDVLGLGDSSSFDNGMWTWPVDRSRRFYDPRFVYEDWFRR